MKENNSLLSTIQLLFIVQVSVWYNDVKEEDFVQTRQDQPENSNSTHISMCCIWTTINISCLWKKNIISDVYFVRFSNVSNNGGPYPYTISNC